MRSARMSISNASDHIQSRGKLRSMVHLRNSLIRRDSERQQPLNRVPVKGMTATEAAGREPRGRIRHDDFVMPLIDAAITIGSAQILAEPRQALLEKIADPRQAARMPRVRS
jgi:hypothetical protein